MVPFRNTGESSGSGGSEPSSSVSVGHGVTTLRQGDRAFATEISIPSISIMSGIPQPLFPNLRVTSTHRYYMEMCSSLDREKHLMTLVSQSPTSYTEHMAEATSLCYVQ